MQRQQRRRTNRWTVMLGAGLIALGITSFSAWASFTASATKDNTIGTGTMTITLADGPVAFSSDVTNMVPGDTAERFVNIHTGGSLTMQNIKLSSTAGTSSTLDTDATNGLQLVVETCDQAWSGTGGGVTATCGGVKQTVLASRAVIMSNVTLDHLDLDGTTDYLRFTWTLPNNVADDDTFQNLTSIITYSFAGTQPANTVH